MANWQCGKVRINRSQLHLPQLVMTCVEFSGIFELAMWQSETGNLTRAVEGVQREGKTKGMHRRIYFWSAVK